MSTALIAIAAILPPPQSLKVLMVKEGLRPTAALAAPVFSSQGKPIGVVTLVFINPEAVFSFDQADPVAALPFSYRRCDDPTRLLLYMPARVSSALIAPCSSPLPLAGSSCSRARTLPRTSCAPCTP